jgi:hypothetical protein
MVRLAEAVPDDILNVRTADVCMGVVSTKSPSGVKRGGFSWFAFGHKADMAAVKRDVRYWEERTSNIHWFRSVFTDCVEKVHFD